MIAIGNEAKEQIDKAVPERTKKEKLITKEKHAKKLERTSKKKLR